MELKGLRESLTSVKDPRRISYGNIRHKLDDIVIIGLCTVISNGEDYNDMEAFGHEREEWLRTFLELPNGIPDSDTFRRARGANGAIIARRINCPCTMTRNCTFVIWVNSSRNIRRLKRIMGG